MAVPNPTETRAIMARMQRVLDAEFGAGMVSLHKGVRMEDKAVISHNVLVAPPTSAARAAFAPPSVAELISARVRNLAHLYSHLGILPEDLERDIMVRGLVGKVVDINQRRPTYPFDVKTSDGRVWKVGVTVILEAKRKANALTLPDRTIYASAPTLPPINETPNWKGSPIITGANGRPEMATPTQSFGDAEAW